MMLTHAYNDIMSGKRFITSVVVEYLLLTFEAAKWK